MNKDLFLYPDPVDHDPSVTEGPTSAFVSVAGGPFSTIGQEIPKPATGFATLNIIYTEISHISCTGNEQIWTLALYLSPAT